MLTDLKWLRARKHYLPCLVRPCQKIDQGQNLDDSWTQRPTTRIFACVIGRTHQPSFLEGFFIITLGFANKIEWSMGHH